MFLMYFIFLGSNRAAWIDWVNFAVWALVAAASSFYLTWRWLKAGIVT